MRVLFLGLILDKSSSSSGKSLEPNLGIVVYVRENDTSGQWKIVAETEIEVGLCLVYVNCVFHDRK